MTRLKKAKPLAPLVKEWPLTAAATLGSSVRARGIMLEVRAHLPAKSKQLVHFEAGSLTLRLPDGSDANVAAISAVVERTLNGIDSLPVIPREIEDILSISSSERHRWLKDGRLVSAGTRTVKLRGRARKITFHVFDPRYIEDLLDRDSMSVWREDDAIARKENRRRAAGKAAITRARRNGGGEGVDAADPEKPVGWDEFEREGFLR